MPEGHEIMTTKEVAEYLKTSAGVVKRMARDGRLRGTKIGADWRFYRFNVDALFAGRKTNKTCKK